MSQSNTIPGDFEFRPAYILMKFLEEEYDQVEADVLKEKIRFNQWPSGQVAITIKCSSNLCNINKNIDKDQLVDPHFRYFQYKEWVQINMYQTSNSNDVYPSELSKLLKYFTNFIKFNRTSLHNNGIGEIYIDSRETPKESKKNRFHAIITVVMKYTKAEIHLDESIANPALTGDEPKSDLDELPENILMQHVIDSYPLDHVPAGLVAKNQVRFKQEYQGQGMLAITIHRLRNEPEMLDNARILEYNYPEIIISADIFSNHPTTEDEKGNLYWNVRKYFERLFRVPRALRFHNIPLIECTRIIERDSVEIDTKKYKGDVFRILFYVRLTYMLRVYRF